ncbi:MAG: pyruvate formate lyase family protein, partial [Phycisphaeraceae bacterium]
RQVAQVPPTSELSTFEDVWQAYATVAEAYVEALAVQERIEYDVTDAEVPMLFASMLTSDCIARGRGAFGGGARYRGGTLETYGNTNAADSLRAIQQLVFERGEVSLPELVDALDENFEGGEALREKLASVPKYGNDDAAADAMARRVHEHICAVTRQQAGPAGLDSYLVVIINNWANTILGKATMASADGRGAGEPMANGNNPSSGSDVSGVTAFLNSIASLRADVHAGAVQNMKFSRAWFGQMRPKFDALLRTYFARGGTQAMITVLSRADLEAAMREPEKWGHLMVRVGGFSIRFVDLPEDAQRELLARTLH